MRCKLATQFFERLQSWRVLGVAAFALMLLPSGATFLSLGKPALAARLKPTGLQQKSPSSNAKKPYDITHSKSVLVKPSPTPPPQQRPLQVIVVSSQQPPRIGEEVRFSVGPLRLLREYAPLTINFGDGASASNLETNPARITHRYGKDASYSVSVVRILQRGQPFQLSDTLTVTVGTWSLNASATEVEIGQPVTFAIDQPSADRAINYRFHFNDSQPAQWVSDAEQGHRFYSVGPQRAGVDIGLVVDGSTQRLAGAESPEVNVKSLTGVVLNVDRSSIEAGQDVSFTTRLASKFLDGNQNIRYNFLYSEGEPSGWQSDSGARHPYSAVGGHSAYVQVGYQFAGSDTPTVIGQSISRTINVTVAVQTGNENRQVRNGNSSDGSSTNGTSNGPPGRPGWRDYTNVIITALAVIALAILFAGYQTMKGRFSVKPDYQAHRDIGIAQTTGGSLAIEFDIRLKPDVTEAQYQLDVPEAGLIRYERRQHE